MCKSIKEKFTTLITKPATTAGKWKKHYTKVKKDDFKLQFSEGAETDYQLIPIPDGVTKDCTHFTLILNRPLQTSE
jgi:hypothetical protein